ncbi:MAG TPA: polysaccharide deacetylase family protein [Pseudoneobacillus sp.]|nr:polysaccharide deacetylase family protein [Pseudoneobacillus sp.]
MKKKLLILVIMFISLILSIPSVQASDSTYKRGKYEKTGHVFWEINTKDKLVALTFDDGPDPIFTPQVLDALAKYDAKATFFVIGAEAERFPEIVKRQAKEGHEVANHTYRHKFRDNFNSDILKDELEHSAEIIQKITGEKPTLFRPHSGFYNDTNIETAITNGYQVILWTWHQDTKDWSRPGVEKITHNVVSDAAPGDIVIFHDAGGDRSQTVKALKNILEILYKNGYKCVTVSDMLNQTDSIITHPKHMIP